MSRGLGPVQRRILAVLANTATTASGWSDTGVVCTAVYLDPSNPGQVTGAQERRYRTSLAKLVKAGLVKRGHRKGKQRDYMLKITDLGMMAMGYNFGATPDAPPVAAINAAHGARERARYARRQASMASNAVMRAIMAGADPADIFPKVSK